MLNKLRLLIREMGFFPACLHICNRVLSRSEDSSIFTYYFFFEQPLDVSTAAQAQRPSAFSFDWLESYDPGLAALPRAHEKLEERFASGSHCLLARKSSEMVACAWFSFEQYVEDEVRCTYSFREKPEAVWDYDVYVVPQYRIGRAFLRTWEAAGSGLMERGYSSTLSRISAFNAASLGSHRKLGGEVVGRALFVTLGKAQLMLATMSPYIHFSIAGASEPTLEFS